MRETTKIGWLVLAVATSAACGSVDGEGNGSWTFEPPTEGTPAVEEQAPSPVAPADTTSALSSCEIEPLWWAPDSVHQISARHFEWTPDAMAIVAGGDAFGGGQNAWRGRDGAVLYDRAMDSVIDTTTAMELALLWRRTEQGPELALVDWSTRETVWRHEPGHSTSAALSPDGRRVAMMECGSHEEPRVTLTIREVASDRTLYSEQLSERSCTWWANYGPQTLEFSPDGEHLAASVEADDLNDPAGRRTAVTLISETTSGFQTSEFELTVPEASNGYIGVTASMTFHPSSDSLTIVSSNGIALEVDTETAQITGESKVGAFAGNYDTYLPLLPASPMDWTAAGDVRAFVESDGALIVELADGVELAKIEAPESSDLSDFGWEDIGNPVMSAAFSPANDMIAVAFRKGMGVWGCAGALPEPVPSGLRGVTATASWTDAEYPFLELEAEVEGEPAGFVTGYRLFIDGEPLMSFDGGTPIQYYATGGEPFEVRIEVDDGSKTVTSEPMTVRRPR